MRTSCHAFVRECGVEKTPLLQPYSRCACVYRLRAMKVFLRGGAPPTRHEARAHRSGSAWPPPKTPHSSKRNAPRRFVAVAFSSEAEATSGGGDGGTRSPPGGGGGRRFRGFGAAGGGWRDWWTSSGLGLCGVSLLVGTRFPAARLPSAVLRRALGRAASLCRRTPHAAPRRGVVLSSVRPSARYLFGVRHARLTPRPGVQTTCATCRARPSPAGRTWWTGCWRR